VRPVWALDAGLFGRPTGLTAALGRALPSGQASRGDPRRRLTARAARARGRAAAGPRGSPAADSATVVVTLPNAQKSRFSLFV
jgi:hypothetical protein